VTSGNLLLGNRYRLTGRIAAGGMGEVWRAVDELLGREVAVKLLRQHVAADPSFRERFRHEARITAGLADPGIAQVFDYGEQEDLAYLVMELVVGEPLSAILARHGTLSADITLDLISQTARGLHAAHRSGVIHRDIKPGNLLITETGQVKITDFGIARALQAAPMTRTGTVLGTAQYVSPEQASGSPLTPATDIYSLGVVAYECLAGRPPFVADTQVAIALMHLNEPPPPLPPHVPGPVRDLVMAMLSKAPEQRPGGAQELAEHAARLREQLAAGADLSTVTDPAARAIRRDAPATGQGAVAGAGGPATGAAARPIEPGTYPSGGTRGMPTDAAGAEPPRRRATTVVLAAVGAAAAAGIAALAFVALRDTGGVVQDPATPSTRATAAPTAAPTSAGPDRHATLPIAPGKSVRPIPPPSATVERSASETPQPSQTPSTTPTPTREEPSSPPSTPTSPTSPTPTPSETPTPSVTPTATETETPDGET